MLLDLPNYRTKVRSAVKLFWRYGAGRSRMCPITRMAGFSVLIVDIVAANGLSKSSILQREDPIFLPGHFSAIQPWDLVVLNQGRLIAAIAFDIPSGTGLSTGECFTRAAVISRGIELQAAYRRSAFGNIRKPFVGYLALLEDSPTTRVPVKNVLPNFPLVPEFKDASYAERYNILCRKLMAENLYTSAAVILSPRSASKSGEYSEMSNVTGLKQFVSTLAGHIAAEAAM